MGFVRLLGFYEFVGWAFCKFFFFCSFVFLLVCFDVYVGKSKGSMIMLVAMQGWFGLDSEKDSEFSRISEL